MIERLPWHLTTKPHRYIFCIAIHMVAMVTVLFVLYCVVVVCCGVRSPSDPMFIPDVPQVSSGKHERYWESVGDALETSRCLRSLDIQFMKGFYAPHKLSLTIESLCRNETLTELTIITDYLRGMYIVSDT